MQSLRKLVLVLAVFGLAVSMASAQTVMNCSFSVENPRTIRPEGVTELVGDVRLDCAQPTTGTMAAVTVDIRVQFVGTTNVTSRVIGSGLDAILVRSAVGDPAPAPSGVTFGADAFQGVLGPGPTAVTFGGIMWDPAGASSVGSTFRLRNVRVVSPTSGQVSAFVSIFQTSGTTGSVSPSVTPPSLLPVASVSDEGLKIAVTDKTSSSPLVCTDVNGAQAKDSTKSDSMSRAFAVQFKEPTGFNEYLKTDGRVGTTITSLAGENGVTGWATLTDAGVANTGTRLRVQVTGVPSGVKVFVSRAKGPAEMLLPQLVNAECGNVLSGFIDPQLAVATNSGGLSGEGTVELTVASGTATACYEIVGETGATNDDIRINVYIAYLANVVPTGTVISGTGAIVPVSTSNTPNSTRPIPRFKPTSVTGEGVTLASCKTVLLFPFVAASTGFDTGIAISNTSADSPVDADISPNNGACTLNFFGNVPVTPATSSIAAGANATWLLSNVAPGFVGYIYADCSFVGAHGYAFITDLGANKFAQGYIALVVGGVGGAKAFDQ